VTRAWYDVLVGKLHIFIQKGPACRDFRRALCYSPAAVPASKLRVRSTKACKLRTLAEVLGFALLYVAWSIFEAVREWADRRVEQQE
jgi:hypothetical protein